MAKSVARNIEPTEKNFKEVLDILLNRDFCYINGTLVRLQEMLELGKPSEHLQNRLLKAVISIACLCGGETTVNNAHKTRAILEKK